MVKLRCNILLLLGLRTFDFHKMIYILEYKREREGERDIERERERDSLRRHHWTPLINCLYSSFNTPKYYLIQIFYPLCFDFPTSFIRYEKIHKGSVYNCVPTQYGYLCLKAHWNETCPLFPSALLILLLNNSRFFSRNLLIVKQKFDPLIYCCILVPTNQPE